MTTRSGPGDEADTVISERRPLLHLAYRLLGSLSEAEDAVQEAYARWYGLSAAQRDAIQSPGAWLTTVTSRICLNLLSSARVRRETYVGEWIPEPLPQSALPGIAPPDAAADPADRVTMDESVTMAFLVLLESMTPPERVAFILHDVFRYPFAQVAEVTGRTPPACRQLASSARRRIRARPAPATQAPATQAPVSQAPVTQAPVTQAPVSQAPATPASRQAGVIRAFKIAWEAKDIDAIVGLLAPDATATADGGGRAVTFLHPIVGGEQVARAWVEIARRATGAMSLRERAVNGQPGLVAEEDGRVVTVFAFDVEGGRIRHIWAVRNPDKLRRWAAG